MPRCERVGRLVDLCEEAQSLAKELNLDFIAFLTHMVVLEARQAHYFSDEDAEEHAPIDATPIASPRRNGKRPSAGQASNVTLLSEYRDASHARLAVPVGEDSPTPGSQSA
jgi:hypothetical protein